jgi:Uma2 family endonuclease
VARARANLSEPWTVEEFLAWEREQEERYEYVDGVIRHARPQHDRGQRVQRASFAASRRSLPRVRGRGEGRLGVGDHVSRRGRDLRVRIGGGATSCPSRISWSRCCRARTQGFDRGPKLDAYQQIASLKQYILIAQEEIRVSVYERDEGGWRYRTLENPDARLAFAVGGGAMTLAEIYERTTAAEAAARPSA